MTGCGRVGDSQKKAPDAFPVDAAVDRLGSGSTVAAMNHDADSGHPEARQIDKSLDLNALREPPKPGIRIAEDLGVCAAAPMISADQAAKLSEDAPEWKASLAGLAVCLSDQLVSFYRYDQAFRYVQQYRTGLLHVRLSSLSEEALDTFLKERALDSRGFIFPHASSKVVDDLMSRRRSYFLESELMELQLLAMKRTMAVWQGERAMFALLDAYRPVFDHFAKSINRYELLLALRDSAKASEEERDPRKASQIVAAKVLPILKAAKMIVPENFEQLASFLNPFGVLAACPDVGHETDALNNPGENPVDKVLEAFATFGGPEEGVKKARDLYAGLLKQDEAKLPVPAAIAAPHAVRVTVMDSGIDYVRYPELATFLGSGSRDWGDGWEGDLNPFLPASDFTFSHGSGTTATVLSVLAHFAPQVLRDRMIDLSVWKLQSIRGVLSYPIMRPDLWANRLSAQESLITAAEIAGGIRLTPQGWVTPQILSASMTFTLGALLKARGQEGLMAGTPWLWVMAAGNEGVEVEKDAMSACLNDIPAAQRPTSRLLCVGALKRGIVNDRVAGYSNFGPRVDVYAYESYSDLCPNGTSCATPAISGAVAALAALDPSLTPEQLRARILEASEERELEVDPEGSNEGPTAGNGEEVGGVDSDVHHASVAAGPAARRRVVRVFDPATMMDQLLRKPVLNTSRPTRLGSGDIAKASARR
jgi:hypothetical protein